MNVEVTQDYSGIDRKILQLHLKTINNESDCKISGCHQTRRKRMVSKQVIKLKEQDCLLVCVFVCKNVGL